MANILIHPNSGIIEFSTGTAGGGLFNPNFTGGALAARMIYDNYGGLNFTSYVSNPTGLDRFSVDGANGRLFSVTDSLSGSLFSVNDIAGLPIIEAFDDNTVIMGAFNRKDFIITGNSVGIGALPNTGTQKLFVSGNFAVSGSSVFSIRPTVNGTGVLLSGEAATSQNLATTGSTLNTRINNLSGYINSPFSNIVFTTGNQTIGGYKLISGNPTFTILQVGGYSFVTPNPYLGDIRFQASNAWLGASSSSTLDHVIGFNTAPSMFNVSNVVMMPGSSFLNRHGAVLVTGDQTISGIKTFANSGIFSLSNALASGLPNNPLSVVASGNTYVQLNIQNRATGVNASADLVITANNGTDSSNFINLGINNVGYNDPAFTNGTGLDGYLFIDGGNLDIGTRTPGRAIEFHAGGTTVGSTIARISQSGLNVVSGNLTVNNTGVLLSGDAATPANLFTTGSTLNTKINNLSGYINSTSSNIVFTTGNQVASGTKTFDIIEIRNTNYNYFITNITLDNNYINLANSTSGITATLPSIASGRNYIVKNLNTGTLTVTGSVSIDGNVNLKLYKNESAHLLGVNNVGFTGWVTLNTNPGAS